MLLAFNTIITEKYKRDLMKIRFFQLFGLIIINMLIISCSALPKEQKFTIVTSLVNGKYEYSKSLLDKMVKRYDTFDISMKCDYHYYNGCYYYSIEDYEQAEDEFNKCLELNPAYMQALYSRASLKNINLKDYSGAIQDYKKIIEIFDYCEITNYFSDSSIVTLYKIYGLDESKLPPESREEIISKNSKRRFRSITKTPDMWKIQCYRKLIECYKKNHEIRKAINCINELLIKESKILVWQKHSFFNKILGNNYLELKEYENAINAFKSYIEHDKEHYEIYYKIGVCYFHLEDFESSILELTTCLNLMRKIDVKEIETFNSSINEKVAIKHNKKALKEYSEFIVSVLLHRAKSYSKLEEYEKSIIDLNEVISIDPNNENAYYYRGYYNKFLGKSESALKDFLKVLTLNPNLNPVNYSIAIIYDSKEKYKSAKKYYSKFIEGEEDKTSQKLKYSNKRLSKINRNINP
jgi:tetratricopeptide (TPR) repeat protein